MNQYERQLRREGWIPAPEAFEQMTCIRVLASLAAPKQWQDLKEELCDCSCMYVNTLTFTITSALTWQGLYKILHPCDTLTE